MAAISVTGDLLVFGWALGLGSLAYPLVMTYNKTTKVWSFSVGTINDTAGAFTFSTPISMATNAKNAIGSLVHKGSGSWDFIYCDDTSGNRILKTTNNMNSSSPSSVVWT